MDRRPAFLGNDPDHPAAEVAVFSGGNAGDYLDGLDIFDLETACRNAGQPSEICVVAHPYAIDLDRYRKGGIAGRNPAGAERYLVL